MVSKPSEVDGCWRLSSSMTLVTAGSCSVDVPTATLGVGSCREGWLDSQASPGLPFPTTHTLVKAPDNRTSMALLRARLLRDQHESTPSQSLSALIATNWAGPSSW